MDKMTISDKIEKRETFLAPMRQVEEKLEREMWIIKDKLSEPFPNKIDQLQVCQLFGRYADAIAKTRAAMSAIANIWE